LLTAYGDIGAVGICSCFGMVGLAPYTEEEDATTQWPTFVARIASSTLKVPVVFAS
jgi:hypothetical protein